MAINIHQEQFFVQKEILNVIINKQYVHHLKKFLLYLINLVHHHLLILINIEYEKDLFEYLNEEFLIKVLLYDIQLKNLMKKENRKEEIMYDLMDNKLVQ
jgi:hypothetical protein